ncbi:MAG: lipopolysaccharide biosynthesis protein, partial [Sphingobacteriales bacterium]
IDRLSGAHDAGIYAAAFRLVDAVNMFGFLFAAFLVSYIAREGINQETAFILRITRTFLLIPAVLLSAMGWFYSDKINEILYYSSSTQTTEVIRILLLCLPALALVHIYGSVLTAAGEIKLFRNISGMMSLLLVLTDIAFIPRYGILSAAWVAVVFQSVYALIVMWYAISKKGLKTYLVDLIVIMGIGLVLWISLNS